jgi:hypothetical protein
VKVDRYTKVVLTVIAGALSALAINYIIAPQPAVAAAPAQGGEGRYQLVVADETLYGWERAIVIDTRSGTLYNAKSVVDLGRDDPFHHWTLAPGRGYSR